MTSPVASPACRVCGSALHPARLELGRQPLCNRFLRSRDEVEATFPLSLATCSSCGVMQIVEAVPASEVAPRFDWITYNEAEGHLDALVERLRALGAWSAGSVVGGVSYKDTTTLARLAAGRAVTWEVGAEDLGLQPGRVEIDAVQDRLDVDRARAIAQRHPPADLLLVRHVLEHAHDLPGFLAAVTALVKPGGWLVFEAPDASGMLDLADYSQVWEEHLVYFTSGTMAATLARHGLSVVETTTVRYPFENALVVVARRPPAAPTAGPDLATDGSGERALAFFEAFEATRLRHRRALADTRIPGRSVAVLGAGHLACTWLNLMGLGTEISCVIDDDPRRSGLSLPGSRLPIVDSGVLRQGEYGLCLLAVNPLVEDRVVARHLAFQEGGGMFRSIFPASRRPLVGARP